MYKIRRTPEFHQWFDDITDEETRRKLLARLDKVKLGLFGDIKFIDAGVWELREDFGPGWRMYYTRHGKTLILMLGGGIKTTQKRDIKAAVKMAKALRAQKGSES
jgi:putative addiction module killer protein